MLFSLLSLPSTSSSLVLSLSKSLSFSLQALTSSTRSHVHLILSSSASMSTSMNSHAFAGNPIRSRTPKPTDPFSPTSAFQTLKTLLSGNTHDPSSPAFKVLPFRKGKPLARTTTDSSADLAPNWHLCWLSLGDCKSVLENSEANLAEDSLVYLGSKSEDDVVYWAVDVSEANGLVEELGSRQLSFVELRTLMVATDWSDERAMGELAVAGHARALLEWHNISRFCGHCGDKTVPLDAGRRKQCSNELCKKRIYPRVDPVVIMLVIDRENDRALLSRQSRFVPRMWSCLAGFIEPGESLEEAVRRETWEETGIEVGEVIYHSSQPWPEKNNPPWSTNCSRLPWSTNCSRHRSLELVKEDITRSYAQCRSCSSLILVGEFLTQQITGWESLVNRGSKLRSMDTTANLNHVVHNICSNSNSKTHFF